MEAATYYTCLQKEGRILAIDYGLKRVGLAITDPMHIIATPMASLTSQELMHFLKNYFEKEVVSTIVMGMPYRLDGQPSNMSTIIKSVGIKLEKTFPQQALYYYDERFTSKLAKQSLYQAGYRKTVRANKGNIDSVSAAILLQSFLNACEAKKANKGV